MSERNEDRLIYMPESCGSMPLTGILLTKVVISDDGHPDWRALVIRTTQPTLARHKGSVVRVPEGVDVLLPMTAKLDAHFSSDLFFSRRLEGEPVKTTRTRAWHLREILGHLDALVDDLDAHSPTWNEPLAKQNFREMRKLFEKCFAEEWAKEGDK